MAPLSRLALALALLAVLVALEWQMVPLPFVAKASRGSDAWTLPEPLPPNPAEKAMEVLAATSPWGRLPGLAEQPPLTPPNWRIVGIAARGEERVVLVRTERQPARQLKIGDALPGGSTILEINDDSLCLLVDGKKRMLPLYPQGPRPL